MAVSDVSLKIDVIIRIFKISKYQNILALTVWPIVLITLLFLQNRQFGRFTAKISNMLNLHFDPFWSNVTSYMSLKNISPIIIVVVVNFQKNTEGMISPKFSKTCPVIWAHVAVTEKDPCALVKF